MPPPPRESLAGKPSPRLIFQKVRTESSEGYTTKAAFASPPHWFSSQPRTSSKHECLFGVMLVYTGLERTEPWSAGQSLPRVALHTSL
ncbi:hypothetical protein I79_017858 [Cricetulus griseus]|uniref:Uncharacterized protein n=1 Tax=Cricetulus griseus TaxID=10029 RepID=G3I357_CRIGR|nr:hypothetical protein I79_017858 [Cricetulus griseus]